MSQSAECHLRQRRGYPSHPPTFTTNSDDESNDIPNKEAMDRDHEYTYRALIKPVPPTINLANVSSQPGYNTCQFCAVIVPDRSKVQNGLIRTSYDRIDYFPNFPELKSSAKAGCGLCKVIRKTIRSSKDGWGSKYFLI
jgi:hypothetical protein